MEMVYIKKELTDGAVSGPDQLIKLEKYGDLESPRPNFPAIPEVIPDEKIRLTDEDAVLDSKTGMYYCLHCHKEFPKTAINEHMIKKHGYRNILYKCCLCSLKFEKRAAMIDHRTTAHQRPMASCDICHIKVGQKYLQKHIETVHSTIDNSKECDICKHVFKNKATLRDHVKSVHQNRNVSVNCDLCPQVFKSKKYLSNHKRNVHPKGDKIFQCTWCAKVFKSRICLHQHTKHVHAPADAEQCPHCPKKFKSKAHLTQHLKHVHPETRNKRR